MKNTGKATEQLGLLKKIYSVFDKKQKKKMLLLFCTILLNAFIELLCVPIVLPLINLVTEENAMETNGLLNIASKIFHLTTLQELLTFSLLLIVAVYVVKNMVVILVYKWQYKFTYSGQKNVSARIMDCYIHQPYLFHSAQNVSTLQRDVSTDVANFFTTVLTVIQMFTEIFVCFALAMYLFVQDFLITLITVLLLAVLLGSFLIFYKKKLGKLGEQARQFSASVNKWVLQSFGGIKEVKTTGKEKYFLNRYNQENEKYMNTLEKQQFLVNVPRPIMEALAITILLVSMLLRMQITGDTSSILTTLSVFAVAAFRLLPSFNRMAGYLTTLSYYRASIDAVDAHLKLGKTAATKQSNASSPKVKLTLDDKVSLKNITFSYSTEETSVLNNINLDICKNQSVALIGASGSGKSTLADILLGVLKPQKGGVYTDGKNIFENLSEWYQIIGYIPQTIYLLDDTIRANIAFGIPEAEVNEDKLWKAVTEAQLEEFVFSLENGLDTTVGERGVRLSGGQRQRIGIARALYNEPQILILDEATSALDNETERAVMESINHLQGEKTMMIIAHRLTTIRNCDCVYDVKDGNINLLSKEERVNREK